MDANTIVVKEGLTDIYNKYGALQSVHKNEKAQYDIFINCIENTTGISRSILEDMTSQELIQLIKAH